MRRAYHKLGNTKSDGTSLYLHGYKIATHTPDGLEITNAGWFTQVTKERLNGLPGVHIQQKDGKWFLNGREWNGKPTLVK